MAIIKKKDLKSFRLVSESKKQHPLDELVDVNGAPIEGDRTVSNDSEIESAKTTDAVVAATTQGRYSSDMYGGGMGARRRVEGEEEEDSLTEDIQNDDMNGNNVADIQDLSTKFNKPIAASKVQELLNTITKNNLNGEEIGIVLTHIMANIKTDMIPPQYKEKIKSFL